MSKGSQVGYSGIQYGPIAPEPTPQYNYTTTAGQPHNETLVSLNTDYPGDQWAYVAYEDGKEVGVSIVEAGTPATSVVINSSEIIDTGLIVTDINGVASAPQKPFVANAIYTVPSDTATVTVNPVNMGPVQYFDVKKSYPSITLSVGVSEDS